MILVVSSGGLGWTTIVRILSITLLCFLGSGAGAQQQQATTPPAPAPAAVPNDSACTYQSCALSIAPVWNGLAVVRGVERQRVTNLHFFWPRDISGDLRGRDSTVVGADSVNAHLERAIALRRAGAGFTDLGAVTLGVAIFRALRDGRASTRDQVVGATALGALVIAVPLQFAADGELSRAVWWHNVRFAR